LLQIHTNINKKLRIYGKKSGHNPENIGIIWTLTL
jgi:hypothetical protein